jgi:hypothetical protein
MDKSMLFLTNHAFWVLVSAVAVYWASVWVVGSEATRDGLGWATMFLGIVLTLRYVPHAWDRFMRGGGRSNWQLLMGLSLFWSGTFVRETWNYAIRFNDRPQWMIDSPLNGFWTLWIVGAGALCWSASIEAPLPIPQTRIYYIVIGAIGGLLVGVAGSRMFQVGLMA